MTRSRHNAKGKINSTHKLKKDFFHENQLSLKPNHGGVVIPSHDPNVIFSLANNRTSVIVF
jgi:hypothetical protein